MRAVILVAGLGRRLAAVFTDPKCLLPIAGATLIERYLGQLAAAKVDEIILVVGHRRERIVDAVSRLPATERVRFVVNPEHQRGSILSLWSARDALDQETLLMDGDVYFEPEVLGRLWRSPHPDVLAVDTSVTSTGEEYMAGIRNGLVVELGRQLKLDHPLCGEWVGFSRLSAPKARRLRSLVEEMVTAGQVDVGYEIAFERLVGEDPLPYEPVAGLRWTEIDFPEDVERAEALARGASR